MASGVTEDRSLEEDKTAADTHTHTLHILVYANATPAPAVFRLRSSGQSNNHIWPLRLTDNKKPEFHSRRHPTLDGTEQTIGHRPPALARNAPNILVATGSGSISFDLANLL